MRALSMFISAACVLAAPSALAQQCEGSQVSVSAQRGAADVGAGGEFTSTGGQLIDDVEGAYALSNGRRLDLIDIDDRLYADFGRRRIELREVGPQRFASRGGDVQMSWAPGRYRDRIVLSYPADSEGHFAHGCT